MADEKRSQARVSVVIPVRDGARDLAKALAALQEGAGHVDEVVVVDDGSADSSPAVAASFGVRVERMPAPSGAAAARNHGARCAGGGVLFFLDADVVAPPDTVARAARWLDRNPEYAAVFGSYDDSPEAEGVVSRFRNLLHHYTHQTARREASTFWTGCGLVRREPFDAVGGFDPAWTGLEDIELGYRLRAKGHRIALDPTLQVKHLKRWSLGSMIATDLAGRARHWTRLILERGNLPDDLNVRFGQRISVALAFVATAALVAAPIDPRWLGVTAAALAGVVWINRGFYAFLARRGGMAFAIASVLLHVLYFLCAGLGSLLALAQVRAFGPRRSEKGASPA